MIFVAGLIILALTWAAAAVYLLRRGERRLPDIGTREAWPMLALGVGYLAGVGCIVVSLAMLAYKWLP